MRTAKDGRRAVVHVTLWRGPYLGNYMLSQLALAETLAERLGVNSHFVLALGQERPDWLADLEAAGATWSVLPASRRRWYGALVRTCAERRGALLATHFTRADLPGAYAGARCRLPVVWHVHTGFERRTGAQRLKDLVKVRLVGRRQVARVVVVSPWLAALVERRGYLPSRIVVAPNPILTDRFRALPARDTSRATLGIEADGPVLLGMGWWPEAKGVDTLLDAVSRLVDQGARLSLLLIGEERLRTFLNKRYQNLPRWVVVKGFAPDVRTYFAAADLFVSASRHEGQSLAIGEALACGLPVVMSDIPGAAIWRDAPGVTTYAPAASTTALAAALEGTLAALKREHAQAPELRRRWVVERAGLNRWREQICNLYGALLEPPER